VSPELSALRRRPDKTTERAKPGRRRQGAWCWCHAGSADARSLCMSVLGCVRRSGCSRATLTAVAPPYQLYVPSRPSQLKFYL
jgi:hypothetical protein